MSVISRYNPHEQKLFGVHSNLECKEILRPKNIWEPLISTLYTDLVYLSIKMCMYECM